MHTEVTELIGGLQKKVALEMQVSTSTGSHPNAPSVSFAVSFFEIHIHFPKNPQHLDEGNKSFVLITRHHNICFKLLVVELQHNHVKSFEEDSTGFSAEILKNLSLLTKVLGMGKNTPEGKTITKTVTKLALQNWGERVGG